jgi:hypothetical protein
MDKFFSYKSSYELLDTDPEPVLESRSATLPDTIAVPTVLCSCPVLSCPGCAVLDALS